MISVIGLGYVGSANATLLAAMNDVYIYDINQKKIDDLYYKNSFIKDSGLTSALKNESLRFFKGDFNYYISRSEYAIIATSTNYDPACDNLDISSICDVISKIISINKDITFVIRSTVPIGTCSLLKEKFNTKNIIFMPEFLKEGEAYFNSKNPSRIIFGFDKNDKSLSNKVNNLKDIYLSCIDNKDVKILLMNYEEAESTKLFSNTFLALRVAFFNELDTFAEINNFNSEDIINGMCLDSRIGTFYNNPSFGYGGYCLPKDSKTLKSLFKNIPNKIISSCIDSNETRKEYIANQIYKKAKLINDKPVIGFYLLTMKKDSDNYRDSSVLKIIDELKNKDVEIIIYEPLIKEDSYLGVKIINDLDTFLKSSSLVVMNRLDKNIIHDNIYTRDIFNKD